MIILINGTSSSGKSSVCDDLHKRLPGWLNFSTDGYLSMLGEKFYNLHPANPEVHIPNDICYAKKHEDGSYEIMPGKLCSQLYVTIPDVLQLIADQGFNIIVDSFITSLNDWTSYLDKLSQFNLKSIYLYAPEEVISAREKARKDRLEGSAIHWLRQFEINDKCDLAIDSSKYSSAEIVEIILPMIKYD